jgi:hypothetical protein
MARKIVYHAGAVINLDLSSAADVPDIQGSTAVPRQLNTDSRAWPSAVAAQD